MSCDFGIRPLQEVPEACGISDADIELLTQGRHPDPGQLLGPRLIAEHIVVRCWVSGAQAVAIASDVFLPLENTDAKEDPPSEVALQLVTRCPAECPWLFEKAFKLEGTFSKEAWHYEIRVRYGADASSSLQDPYSLGALLPESFLRTWSSGNPDQPPASMFGAHHMELRDIRPGLWGTRFAVWAPHARAVSVVGDFNFWDGRAHPMCRRSEYGTWELFLPVWDLRGQKYGYKILPSEGDPIIKTDAFALEFVDPSDGGHDAKIPEQDDYSRSAWNGTFPWTDSPWLQHRSHAFSPENWAAQPLSIYEVHLASWAKCGEGQQTSYRTLAEPLAKHVKELGFVAVEFLPLSQYPSEQSWGYQCAAGLYAVDTRLGTPDDFRYLVDTLHKNSIAVYIDFVAAHFAKDEWGLARYSGAAQFEYEGALGELPGWGTARFNYSKPEVKSYLIGAIDHWIRHFHVDGIRLDAVAPMIYQSFGREEDGDAILAGRGVVNEDGVKFLRDLCSRVRAHHPDVLMFAEESTNYKWVTCRPAVNATERHSVNVQDLGFHCKWNMGFTFDALAFLGTEFTKRPQLETFGWKKLAWYLAYAFNERWVLPLSHDNANVKSILDQMTPNGADAASKLAHFRMLLMYVIGMPGRPLLFMGSEVGEESWCFSRPIDWKRIADDKSKQHLQSWVGKLMKLYRETPSLHRLDDDADGFAWIDKDSSGRCIYAWLRRAKGEADAIVVMNASSCHVPDYRVAVCQNAFRFWRCIAATCLSDEADASQQCEPMTVEIAHGATNFPTDLPACAAQLWVAGPAASGYSPAVPGGAAKIKFQVNHNGTLQDGEVLRVVGGRPELGSWQPKDGAPLEVNTDSNHIRQTTVDVPLGNGPIEYKFVIVRKDGSVCWEPFQGNRHVNLEIGVVSLVNAKFGHR